MRTLKQIRHEINLINFDLTTYLPYRHSPDIGETLMKLFEARRELKKEYRFIQDCQDRKYCRNEKSYLSGYDY
jgi:hypothetical protein